MLKVIKRLILIFFILIFVIILGLIINNRLSWLKYGKLETNGDMLTNEEIEAINDVFIYLDSYGYDIFTGLNQNTNLVIFNDSYEFLINDDESVTGWDFVEYNEKLNKNIHRKKVDDPQAFAVLVDSKWVGSMSTKNRFNKSIVNTVPIFFPPQVMIMDDEHYKAIIIHEMTHAYEAINNNKKFMRIKTLHNICEKYYENQTFNDLIIQEAYYLEQAILAEEIEDVLEYTKMFINKREKRRRECNMSMVEIKNEKDFEWLEGLARYAEYKASRNSKSMVAKNLLDIDQKVKIKGDDRYYTLGMAQALVLDRLDENWKRNMFNDEFSLEKYLKEISMTNIE